MNTKQIGTAIRKARGKRSVRSVAIEANVQRHQVGSVENASSNYTIETLLALAKVVGVEVKVEPNAQSA